MNQSVVTHLVTERITNFNSYNIDSLVLSSLNIALSNNNYVIKYIEKIYYCSYIRVISCKKIYDYKK